MQILLVRHGDTKLNSTERYWGRSDVELSDAGIKQAEELRARLAGEDIDAAYSSDLKRALVTAKTIVSGRRLEVTICDELREVDFGQLEGLKFDEVNHLYPEVAKMWAERSPELKYPGGESLREFTRRVGRFLGRLEEHDAGETILIVAHSGVLRTLICQLLGIELQHRFQLRLDLASLSIVETYPQRAILSLLNDVSHQE